MAKFDLNDLEKFEEFVGVSKKRIEIQKGDDVAVMELEPLASKYIGKIVYLQNNMPAPKVLNPKEVKTGRKPIYEDEEHFKKSLKEEDYNAYGVLFDLLQLWIKQSYPDLKDESIRKFVYTNSVVLMKEFMDLHNDVDEEGSKKELKDFIKNKQQTHEKPETTTTESTEA